MLVTCAPDSNNLMGLTLFCHQTPLLKRRWQLQRLFKQGNKRFVLALSLNRLGMHNKHTGVLYPKMHVSCSFLSLVTITAISVRASLVKLPCKGLETRMISKMLDRSHQIHACYAHTCVKFKLSCTV